LGSRKQQSKHAYDIEDRGRRRRRRGEKRGEEGEEGDKEEAF
jgi:hypothetical protein